VRPAYILALVTLGGAAVFAFQGGEYSTPNLWQLHREEAEERRVVATLRHTVDSLERAAAAIERDPAVQERVAREAFGMIRRGEFLYRLVPGDSVQAFRDSASR
jgi:cell division protein FtsB